MAPLTAAEKQKRYRDRLRQTNPEKYSTILKNNAERNRNYRKKVKESTTEEEKNKQRLKWREKKRKERKKDSNNTASDKERNFTQRAIKRIYRMWITKKAQYESKINLLNKKVNRFRKQNARLIKKVAQLENLIRHPVDAKENIITPDPNENNIMSPLSKSCSFIDQNLPNVTSEEKEKVKRVLLDHNILTNAVQDAYKNTKNNNERNIFKKMTEHEYVTKYKMKRKVALILGLKGRARRIRQYKNKRNKKTVEEIRQFYERDDVSRATAGKKEVKTSKKEKRQRRYLLKTQKDLFKKYKNEGGKAKYSTFKKHRPFYVLHPKLSNRDTCACVKHENFILKTEKKIPKQTIKTEKTVTKKVQMLSDVRYLPENQGYIDMKKFDASKFITIPVETDLSRSKKNKTPDDIYRNPVPSTSKEGLTTTKKFEQKSLKRKRPHFSDDSTDTDAENFSLHDSSDYCYEDEFLDEDVLLGSQIEQNEISISGSGRRSKIEDKQTRKHDKNVQIEEEKINTTNLENKIQAKDEENKTMEPNQGSDYCYEEEFLDEDVLLGSQIEQNEISISGSGRRSKIEDQKKKTRKHDEKLHIEEEEINATDLENIIQVKEKVNINFIQIGETEKTAKHDQVENEEKKEKKKAEYDRIVSMEEKEIVATGPKNIIQIGEKEKTAEHDQINQKEKNTAEYDEKLRIEEEEIITTGSINIIQIGERENKTAKHDQIIQIENKEKTAEHDQIIQNEEKEKKTTEYDEKVQMEEKEKTAEHDQIKQKEEKKKTTKYDKIVKIDEEEISTTGSRNIMQIGEKEIKTAEHDETLHKKKKHKNIREYDEKVQVEEKEINTTVPKNIIEIGEKVKKTAEYDKIVEKEVKEKNTTDYDEIELKEGDSVIVKYYEKRTWKFYIGFIEETIEQEEDNITYFNIYFLKTVKHPLKFIKPKKIDRDLVPTTNVVKKVQLILSSKEYFLKNETCDKIYFN